ncbi:class I SAM-dependent methyltransferase [Pseudoduganella sp. UC29_71]|uniref:class I SAM-dependent methyltransferase n=1 Tax=Pseudoduganella sp. UC29_71 TaxID=3350174 RepID=UPI0036735E49
MDMILRDRCAVTGADDLEPLYKHPRFPVFMGCVEHPESEDLHADMDWWISRSSGLIQLRGLLPLDVLYPAAHNAGAVGALWARHHSTFAQFVRQYAPAAVLEVGGASGLLARAYQEFDTIPWTIVEPNPAPVEGCNATYVRGFFDDRFRFDGAVDTVVHSHLWEHLYEPAKFMRHLAGFMQPGQHLLFSVPNLQVWLERRYTNCINFEHTVFLTEAYVQQMLAEHGFDLVKKEYFMQDHSIFYAAVRSVGAPAAPALPAALYEQNKRSYLDYVAYHDGLIAELNAKMRASGRPVYLFGAHIFAQSLIAYGLDQSHIVSLLDNDASKQGKRLYGTGLMVQSPTVLRSEQAPCVILKAGVYNAEIKQAILRDISTNVEFWE